MQLQLELPFIVLGLIAGCWQHTPKELRSYWLPTWLGLVLVIVFAKVGQLFLPVNYFDWWEIVWGIVGTLEGMAATAITLAIVKRGLILLKQSP